MLNTGYVAPALEFEDTTGRVVRLENYHNWQSVLLYFMRSTSCPVCNWHVKDLTRSVDEFSAAQVQVLIVVPEDRATAAKWKAAREVPFPVVTGLSDGSPHSAFGLTKKMFGSMQQSGTVLIDIHGVIRHIHSATLPTGSYDKKGIAAAIKNLPPYARC